MNKDNNFFNLKLKTNRLLNNSIIKQTFFVLVLTVILKILGLIFRIVLTRILTVKVIGAYTIILPSVMLFLTLASFSLSITISKIIPEQIVKQEYCQKTILKSGLIIGVLTSLITCVIVILSSKYISYNLLKTNISYIPLLLSVFLIPVSTIDSILKGYFNGISKVVISSKSKIIEELVRIASSIISIYFLFDLGIVVIVSSLIISDVIGEVFSIIYLYISYRKLNKQSTNNIDKKPLRLAIKKVFSMASVTTITQITQSILTFLEPIIYTTTLTYKNYSSDEILYNYSIINAYVIPMIVTFLFIPQVISQVLISKITTSFNENKHSYVKYYTKKSITLSILVGIIIMVILYNYSSDILKFVYGKTYGDTILKTYCLFFITSYITPPIITILHATNNTKKYLIIQTLYCFIKTLLIFLFSYVSNSFSDNSLSIVNASAISSLLFSIIYLIEIKKIVGFKYNYKKIINIIFIIILSLLFSKLLNLFNLHFIISIFLLVMFYLSLIIFTNITICDDK